MNESDQNAMPESSWQVGIENLKHKQRLCCSWAAAYCSLTQQPGETADRQRDSSLGFEGPKLELRKLARQ